MVRVRQKGRRIRYINEESYVLYTTPDHANHFNWLSGLDPASLYFITDQTSFRLDESDAQYVDVIHTDAGVFGNSLASGHTDFWPNGGGSQPGCLLNGKHLQSRDNHTIRSKYFLSFYEIKFWELLLIFTDHTLARVNSQTHFKPSTRSE